MEASDSGPKPWLRVYARCAAVGLILGWAGSIVSMATSAPTLMFFLPILAVSVPLIPLLVYYGSGLLGFGGVGPFTGSGKRLHLILGLPMTFFVSGALVLGLWVEIEVGSARGRAREFAGGSGAHGTVTCDGAPLQGGDELAKALAELRRGRPGHSHNLRRFPVVVRNGTEVLELEFARDSARPNVYWVFQTDRWTTDYNAIGHIETPLLAHVSSEGSAKPLRERR